MEHSSVAILFGCTGAALAYFGTRLYIRRRFSQYAAKKLDGLEGEIRAAYDRLFLLRMGCLILSLAAAGIWILEPSPYVAGGLVGAACLMLYKAYRLRHSLMKRVREEEEKRLSRGADCNERAHTDRKS